MAKYGHTNKFDNIAIYGHTMYGPGYGHGGYLKKWHAKTHNSKKNQAIIKSG